MEHTLQPTPLMTVTDLTVSIIQKGSEQRNIVKKVSFSLSSNEILALVGESGSGKTLTARAIMRLFATPSLYISSGAIYWKGQNLVTLDAFCMRSIRGREISYIPQAPMGALNPMMRIGRQLTEGFTKGDTKAARERATQLLYRCGFSYPDTILLSYPHELSGGMRQRVVIAMALMNSPDLIIADEPTTALDVSLQAEVLALLVELVRCEKSSLLFITHDLGVVAQIADNVIIMKEGSILEEQNVYDLFSNPLCPYTKLLIESSTLQ